jgi:hypothetical protein
MEVIGLELLKNIEMKGLWEGGQIGVSFVGWKNFVFQRGG